MDTSKKYIFTLLMWLPFLCHALPYDDYSTDKTGLMEHLDSVNNVQMSHTVTTITPPDSADILRLNKKHFWRATAETAGFNIGLWAFDRYVQKGHYAYISWETIKENFRHGFEWDNDHLSTNMFLHPYNGSLFYNAGRSNGYNYWQSALFAIGGSAMWEMCMECEYPSTNDIIATPIGGTAIGEVLYRSADLIIDERATGRERFGRELAAFIVSPMRGFTRLINGDATRRSATSGRHFGIPPISVEVSAGYRSLTMQNDYQSAIHGGAIEVGIEYGDKFDTSRNKPFDYFSLLLELNSMETQPLLSRMEIIGRLLSTDLVDTKHCQLSLGMYQHFDYFDSDTVSSNRPSSVYEPCAIPYKLGTPASVGAGAMLNLNTERNWNLEAHAHINFVGIAGILSDYYRYYHRNYNWGTGGSFKVGVSLTLPNDIFSASLAKQFYNIHTWEVHDKHSHPFENDDITCLIQGENTSDATFDHTEARLRCKIYGNFFLSACVDIYDRKTQYSGISIHHGGVFTVHSPKIKSKQIDRQLLITYKF